MLLELLSDFQISIPELGRIEARTHPVVLLTSNNTRELTEALKRRCLYLWLDYPATEHELRDRPPARARALRDRRAQARRRRPPGPPARPQEAALDRGVDRLGARAAAARRRRHLAGRLPRHDVDHRQAPHRPRHRGRAGRSAARGVSFDAQILQLGEALRAEGVAIGTSELNDAFAALEQVSWTEPADFRAALAATLAKSPEDRRIFDLVFERFFFRAAEAGALRHEIREQDGDGITGGERIELDNLREQLLQAIRDGDEAAMRDLARLAIAAFGRRGEGSGVLGVDVQRIRRALGLRSEPGGSGAARRSRAAAAHARADPPLRGPPASGARARADRAHAGAPAQPPAHRARPRAAHRPAAGPRRRPPRGRPAQAPARHPGPRDARAPAPRARRRPPHDARLAPDRRRAGRAQVPPAPPPPPRALRALRRQHLRHQRLGLLPSRPARAPRRVPQDALVRVRRAHLRGHRTSSSASARSAPPPRRSPRTPASPTSPATPTTGACGASSSPRSRTTCTRARR